MKTLQIIGDFKLGHAANFCWIFLILLGAFWVGGGNTFYWLEITCFVFSVCYNICWQVVGTVSLVQKGVPHGGHSRCGSFTPWSRVQPIYLNGGVYPCSKLRPHGRMQPIHLNDGEDTALRAKTSPTQQIYPMPQTQPIDLNGGWDTCRRLIPCNKHSQLTQMVVGTVSQVQKGAPCGKCSRCGKCRTCDELT